MSNGVEVSGDKGVSNGVEVSEVTKEGPMCQRRQRSVAWVKGDKGVSRVSEEWGRGVRSDKGRSYVSKATKECRMGQGQQRSVACVKGMVMIEAFKEQRNCEIQAHRTA